MEETQHPKAGCVELGNSPIKVQLGSTNGKGLPVLFQGSHQGLLLNNQLINYDGSHGHAHGRLLHSNTSNPLHSKSTLLERDLLVVQKISYVEIMVVLLLLLLLLLVVDLEVETSRIPLL